MRSERYQVVLIFLGFIVAILLGYFLYKEIFPEYRIYQNDYVALEQFRSTYTGEPPPEFKEGVKQIVFEREDKGPARVDRCISCHVALELPHFSPTQIAHDINGNIARSEDGTPIKEPNPNYVWLKLNQKIDALTDEKVNQQLTQNGETAQVKSRLKEAANLAALKVAEVDEQKYDVTKVLAMHPLIGKETRPFEFHPVEEYGCTSCHSGNGRGLTTDKAHGPVFDGQYEAEYMGPKREFIEHDSENDPRFAQVFNHKPGDALLFQTSPILVGNLIQSSCVQCHEQSAKALRGLTKASENLAAKRTKKANIIQLGFKDEKKALLSLINLQGMISQQGLDKTLVTISERLRDPSVFPEDHEQLSSQLTFLNAAKKNHSSEAQATILTNINEQLVEMLGSQQLVTLFEKGLKESKNSSEYVDQFLNEQHANSKATGSLFVKWQTVNFEAALLDHIEDTQQALSETFNDTTTISALESDVDWLTKNYHHGEQLYISQACYACHRIAGMARGGVGPELTRAGDNYPWYLKEKLMWPQGTLSTSTMPNMTLDQVELEDLMTFLLAQKGPTKTISEKEYKVAIQEWEAGRKLPWETPVPPSEIHNLNYAMSVFATEGCAACHRLEGYQSNVGYRVEKAAKPSFDALYQERMWFKSLFPEEIRGSAIVQAVEKHEKEIDQHVVDGVRTDSLLEEINKKHPEIIESFYSNFRFASRAKDHFYHQLAEQTEDPIKKKAALDQLVKWKERVHRLLMIYIQEYGLGRLIGPRPNWSGIYRSDEWLMEHFHNPSGHVPRSIMPVFPFDDSKFYALTYMLDVLGRRNRDAVREIWKNKGFDPDLAYHLHCAQCHGDYMQGNGPVATWIYPIPKNLRNAEFLRNLTKENAIQSITHGVKGTPMAPWGEVAVGKEKDDGIPVLTKEEITKIVDWIYTSIPGGTVIRGTQDVPKWNYTPTDVLRELHQEGNQLESTSETKSSVSKRASSYSSSLELPAELAALPKGEHYFAALEPQPNYVDDEVAKVFDVKPNPVPGGDKQAYYIKTKYYTQNNLDQGKLFFDINCAACHGFDADGTGARSSVMVDAKPRMLTNLDWINTRDDLRLLRSIKYGVPGTAMTPWGDFTSSLQRLQLVMYIRSLSAEKELRESLSEALYQSFQYSFNQVEAARIAEYGQIVALKDKKNTLKVEQKSAARASQEETKDISKAVEFYQQQLKIAELLKVYQTQDQKLVSLQAKIDQEKDIYQAIGNDTLTANLGEHIWPLLLKLVNLNAQRIVFVDDKLKMNTDPKQLQQQQVLAKQMVEIIDQQIALLEKNKAASLQDKTDASEKEKQQQTLTAQITSYTKLKGKILTGMEMVAKLQKEEQALITQINAATEVKQDKNG